jgi:hypothetical protein
MKRTHAAMNLITGEVMTSTSAKTLKKRIAIANRYPIYDVKGHNKQWIFAHGED